MLDYAKNKQGPDDRIPGRQADALNLPFDDASFDAAVCKLGVIFSRIKSPVTPKHCAY